MLKRLATAPVLFLTFPAAFAAVIQPTATLPPTSGNYSVIEPICITIACMQNVNIGNFQIVTSMISGNDQRTSSIATLTALAFTNSGGSPGTPLGPVTLSGPINITYFGRSTLTALGTFTSQITFLDFTGVFNGHTIEAMLNPASASLGRPSWRKSPVASSV